MFKKIDGDEAVLVQNGVYKVAALYEYAGGLYAAVSGGFVRLKRNASTSHPHIKLECLHRDGPLWKDRFGRLCTSHAPDRSSVVLDDEGQLPLLTSE